MPIAWENTFDGPDGTPVTVENSGDYGDELRLVVAPAVYTDAWVAAGDGAVQVGPGSALSGIVATPDGWGFGRGEWSARLYVVVPSGGTLHVVGVPFTGANRGFLAIEDDNGRYDVNGYSADEHADDLIGQTIRLEMSTESGEADIVARLWWTDPHSTGEADLQVTAEMGSAWGIVEIQATAPADLGMAYVDELVISDTADWIGPVATQHDEGAAEGELVLYGEADGYPSWSGAAEGTLVLYGEADGRPEGLTPAEGWIVLWGEADGWPGHIGSAEGDLVLYGEADGSSAQSIGAEGTLVLYGQADGMAGASVATGTPIRDMWLGQLGLLHRMRRRGEWERTPELGMEAHVSLHGTVTASRARRAPRVTALSWEHLDRADADAIEEMTLVPARADATIAVVDPDAAAGNLLTPEQSRGRPGPGTAPVAVEHLYQLTGPGSVTVGLVSGVRYTAVSGAQSGTDVTWLHPYYGARGWPVMPGWPVYLAAATTNQALPSAGRLWLTFYDHAGAVIESAAGLQGDGQCEADAPAGAVSVSPRLVVAEESPGLRLLGEARLSFVPQAAQARPLGNGCPVYTVTGYSDAPYLPWRNTSLELQEVRTHAYR